MLSPAALRRLTGKLPSLSEYRFLRSGLKLDTAQDDGRYGYSNVTSKEMGCGSCCQNLMKYRNQVLITLMFQNHCTPQDSLVDRWGRY